jgi:polyferredoxin
MLVWSVWWPALVLSFVFAGRAWCAVCPMSSLAGLAQRVVSLKRRTPSWLKRHDATVLMAGFFLIVWAEEASGMRHSPRATGVLLGSILLGAVATAVLLPRRAWCRYLCPLGGFAGVCSMSGLVELRPTADICAAKCQDHSCFKGDAGKAGCPLFNHVMFVDTNRDCVLCLDCLRACPNDSPQLNLRLPALELLTMREGHATVGRFTALLASLLAGVTLLQWWRGEAGYQAATGFLRHEVVVVTVVLLSAAAFSQLALWWLARRVVRREDVEAETAFWRTITAWVPLVAAGFIAHELAFVPALRDLRIDIARAAAQAGSRPALSLGVLALAQAVVLLSGLVVTAIVLRRLAVAQTSGPLTSPVATPGASRGRPS